MTLDNILEEIKRAETIVILTHETPDGDAIGSSLAMKLALKQFNVALLRLCLTFLAQIMKPTFKILL